jgi:small-conductance mechanosensitive channel
MLLSLQRIISEAVWSKQVLTIVTIFASSYLFTRLLRGRLWRYLDIYVKDYNLLVIIKAVFLPFLNLLIISFVLLFGAAPQYLISSFARVNLLFIGVKIISHFRRGKCENFFVSFIMLEKIISIFGAHRQLELGVKHIKLHVLEWKVSLYTFLHAFTAAVTLYWLASAAVRIGSRIIVSLVSRNNRSARDKELQVVLYTKLLEYVVYSVGFIIILNVIGVSYRTITIFGSAIGIGLGFGLQRIAANFISGIILMAERSIKYGDIIQEGDKILGVVKHMGIRATFISTFDGREVIIPNEDLVTKPVTNLTHNDKNVRSTVRLYIKDLNRLKEAMVIALEAVKRCENISNKRLPRCILEELVPGVGICMTVNFWIDDVVVMDVGAARTEAVIAAITALNDAGIEVTTRIDAATISSPIMMTK